MSTPSCNLCQNCKQKPCYTEQDGRAHHFCGKTCAIAAGALQQPTTKTCKTCPKPCWVDGRVTHPSCSKTCADKYKTLQQPTTTRPCPTEGISQKDYLTSQSVILFYNETLNPLTAFLGNFHPCDLTLSGYEFPCAEALYQASKFINPLESLTSDYNKQVLLAFSSIPKDANAGHNAWSLNKDSTFTARPDFREKNVEIMRRILILKYEQNPGLAALLNLTGIKPLTERTDRDSFWGDGKDGKGENNLGKLHMQLRLCFQTHQQVVVPRSLEEVFLMMPLSTQQHKPTTTTPQEQPPHQQEKKKPKCCIM